MKIVVQDLDEPVEQTEKPGVSFTDDGFNVLGWVTIKVGASQADVHIDELHHATLALWIRYRDQVEMEL